MFIPTIALLLTQSYSLLWIIPSVLISFVFAIYGFSIGMHQTFSHNNFSFNDKTENILAFLSFYSMLQSPITWTTVHKAHHKYADTEKDPHSPVHLGYKIFLPWHHKLNYEKPIKRLLTPIQKFIHKNQWLLFLHPLLASLGGLNSFIFLYMIPVSYLMILQLGFVILSHGKVINSLGNYAKNDFWLNLISFGDGNHEDHHKDNSYPEYHKWFADLIGNRNERTNTR